MIYTSMPTEFDQLPQGLFLGLPFAYLIHFVAGEPLVAQIRPTIEIYRGDDLHICCETCINISCIPCVQVPAYIVSTSAH